MTILQIESADCTNYQHKCSDKLYTNYMLNVLYLKYKYNNVSSNIII